MAQRTHIRVKLTPEGQNILGTTEGWAVLDLDPGFSTRVSKDVNKLSDINTLNTDGVLSDTVPFSLTNNAAFIDFSSPIITDNYDNGIEARLIIDSHELPFDRIWIKNRDDVNKRWEFEFRRSPNHWLELASEKRLNTISLGQVTLDEATVTDGWAEQLYVDGEAVERWIPTDYGGWVDLAEHLQFTDAPVKGVWIEDMRPWLSEYYLLKQGFCEIGWNLEGEILNSDWFRAQFCYVLSREYYTQSNGGLHKIILQSTADFTINQLVSIPILLDDLQYDPGSNNIPESTVYVGGIYNTLPFKAKYRFVFSGYVENTTAGSEECTFNIGDYSLTTGLLGQQYYEETFSFQASQTRYIQIDQVVEVEVGARLAWVLSPNFNVAIKLLKGFRVIIEPANKSLVRGDVVTLNKLINSEHILLDLFKGVIHKINGRVYTDWDNRTIQVFPYRTTVIGSDIVAGFIKDGETPEDITEKVVCDSIVMSRIKQDLNRYTQLSFADSTDAYIESLNLVDPAHSRTVLNSIELPDDTTELQNPFFEPTLEGQNDELKLAKNIGAVRSLPTPYLPRLYDNTNSERSFIIGPRTLFFYGDVSQYDQDKDLKTALFFEGGIALKQFGYGSQIPTLPFHSDAEPTLDGSLVYGVNKDDMYVNFYLGSLQRLKRGTYLDVLLYMSSNDYARWDFRTPFTFKFNGRKIIALMESIRDFAHALDITTPVKFLVEPSDTSCCDGPCGCKFKECDFYQDFGQYMTQDTLDALSLTSFKVNGVEQLDGAVDFGLLNVVEFGEKQFVTNLVDTLNDLAIDYFTFRPSTTDYPLKVDARFFKIKWPSCWSFEIIIESGEGEVYRYRDYDMAQQWFDASWAAMGYGADPVSEPQNCVITAEY